MAQVRERMGNAADTASIGGDESSVLTRRLRGALYEDWRGNKELINKILVKMQLDETLWKVLLDNLEAERQNVLNGGQGSGVVGSLTLDPYSSLSLSVNKPTSAPPGMHNPGYSTSARAGGTYVPLIMYDGESLSGPLTLLPVFVRHMLPGCVITAVVQTLIGTKAGLAILAALGYALAR